MGFANLCIAWICIACWIYTFKDRVSRKIVFPVAGLSLLVTLIFWINGLG